MKLSVYSYISKSVLLLKLYCYAFHVKLMINFKFLHMLLTPVEVAIIIVSIFCIPFVVLSFISYTVLWIDVVSFQCKCLIACQSFVTIVQKVYGQHIWIFYVNFYSLFSGVNGNKKHKQVNLFIENICVMVLSKLSYVL